jgi:hypothetical protein
MLTHAARSCDILSVKNAMVKNVCYVTYYTIYICCFNYGEIFSATLAGGAPLVGCLQYPIHYGSVLSIFCAGVNWIILAHVPVNRLMDFVGLTKGEKIFIYVYLVSQEEVNLVCYTLWLIRGKVKF